MRQLTIDAHENISASFDCDDLRLRIFAEPADRARRFADARPLACGTVFGRAVQARSDAGKNVARAERDDRDKGQCWSADTLVRIAEKRRNTANSPRLAEVQRQ